MVPTLVCENDGGRPPNGIFKSGRTMVDTTIIVPCPECGQRIRGSAERVNETAVCPRGHKFPWNASSLRNPIQPPRKDVEPRGWPVGLGSLLCAVAVYGFLGFPRLLLGLCKHPGGATR